MKEYRHNIINSLAFRTITPVVIIILLTGFGLYLSVLRAVSDFADRQIKEAFYERALDIYQICDKNLNDLLIKRLASDDRAVRIKKGLAIGLIEDFMIQNNIKGVIRAGDKKLLSACCLPNDFPADIEKNMPHDEVALLGLSGKKYYIYSMVFDPWNWHILLIRDASDYSALLKKVRIAYVVTGATLVAAAFVLILYLNSAIKRPVNDIIAPLKKGEKPSYTGQIKEFEFISESIRRIMDSLEEKTKWINHIYSIAVTRKGEDFFNAIVVTIGQMFNLNSLIAKINPDGENATAFALNINGELQNNISFSLKHTPCEGIRDKKEILKIKKDAYKEFPFAKILSDSKTESYIGFPVFDRTGEVIGILNVFGNQREFSEIDINLLKTIGQMVAAEFELLEKESESERLIKQLIQEQKLESIGLLANGLAHNFNNILVGVLGYASLIRIRLEEAKTQFPDENLLDEILKHIDTIELSAQKASNLARELANLAKGKHYEEHVVLSFDINKLIANLGQFLLNTFPKNIEITTDLSGGALFVKGDPSQMEQAILNICINSRDAMPEGGSLNIKTFNSVIVEKNPKYPYVPSGNYATIVIGDTGTGMDEQKLNRVFEPFFTTKPGDKGTGLGLSIAYAIVKAHKGYIMAESAPGTGSTFIIHLPSAVL